MDHGSKNRLTPHDVDRFAGATLFDKIARAVCRAEVLPRKELYESWEVARRVHRLLRPHRRQPDDDVRSVVAGPGRVIDLCCGHALLGALLLILDGTRQAGLAVDRAPPPSQQKLIDALAADFPRVALLERRAGDIDDVSVGAADVVVSAHACGDLSDRVLDLAVRGGAPVAVLPCCHVVPHRSEKPDPLAGWLEPTLAIDVARAARLQQAGYDVVTQTIDPSITPKNRLLIALPKR